MSSSQIHGSSHFGVQNLATKFNLCVQMAAKPYVPDMGIAPAVHLVSSPNVAAKMMWRSNNAEMRPSGLLAEVLATLSHMALSYQQYLHLMTTIRREHIPSRITTNQVSLTCPIKAMWTKSCSDDTAKCHSSTW